MPQKIELTEEQKKKLFSIICLKNDYDHTAQEYMLRSKEEGRRLWVEIKKMFPDMDFSKKSTLQSGADFESLELLYDVDETPQP